MENGREQFNGNHPVKHGTIVFEGIETFLEARRHREIWDIDRPYNRHTISGVAGDYKIIEYDEPEKTIRDRTTPC